MTNESTSKTYGDLWGGRFTEPPNSIFAEFNDSFRIDRRLFAADVRCSMAYADELGNCGAISRADADAILGGLTQMLADAASDPEYFRADAEDVHSFIESKLISIIGDAGRRLHTGRSRNDQVATAFRFWLRSEIDDIDAAIIGLMNAIVGLAERHRDAVMPGYTHLQRAQPILFAHWCLAYFEMLKRDRERLIECRRRVNILPLGSGALAGSGMPLVRQRIAADLGFHGVTANSLDAVSDRDFAIEFCSAASLIMMHLSRMAEDIIIYCSQEFGFITLSDAVSSGSSLMPQKKNPDALELMRGKVGRVFGDLMSLLTVMKGLPLAYNKDMQEDKEAVFDCVDTLRRSLSAAEIVIDNVVANEDRMQTAATSGYLNATEMADYLTRRGTPFRIAHEAVGKLVLLGIEYGKELHELSIEELRSVEPSISDDVFDALTIDASLAAKSAIGGTSPVRVSEALAEAAEYIRNN